MGLMAPHGTTAGAPLQTVASPLVVPPARLSASSCLPFACIPSTLFCRNNNGTLPLYMMDIEPCPIMPIFHKALRLRLYTTTRNDAPSPERGDWSTGTREVLCPKCSQWVKHGYDRCSQPMKIIGPIGDAKRRLRMGDATLLGWFTDRLSRCCKFRKCTSHSAAVPVAAVSALHLECIGAYFKWDVGSLFKTHPFIIHDSTSRQNPGYTLRSVDFTTSVLVPLRVQMFSYRYGTMQRDSMLWESIADQGRPNGVLGSSRRMWGESREGSLKSEKRCGCAADDPTIKSAARSY
ncbi:hypothetical protein DFH09DRAFT_1091365 [Mycena vulgaris]|nr:hypothetical protein DFH09DRAFT_1091365 [Mycena vulgaris]